MEPSQSFWEREDYIKRRTGWMWRLRPWLLKNKCEQCKTCVYKNACHRIPCNERITAKIAKGEECPDFKSMWKKILDNEEPYDWGF